MSTHTTRRRYTFTFDQCPARHDYTDTAKPCALCGTPLNHEAPEPIAAACTCTDFARADDCPVDGKGAR
jgi:hypothetical protein